MHQFLLYLDFLNEKLGNAEEVLMKKQFVM